MISLLQLTELATLLTNHEGWLSQIMKTEYFPIECWCLYSSSCYFHHHDSQGSTTLKTRKLPVSPNDANLGSGCGGRIQMLWNLKWNGECYSPELGDCDAACRTSFLPALRGRIRVLLETFLSCHCTTERNEFVYQGCRNARHPCQH